MVLVAVVETVPLLAVLQFHQHKVSLVVMVLVEFFKVAVVAVVHQP